MSAPTEVPTKSAETSTPTEVPAKSAALRNLLRRLRAHPLGLVGLFLLLLLAGFCFLGPYFYHTDQTYVSLADAVLPPTSEHPLGTDANGFDALGRLMKGGQVSLQIGLLAAVTATVIGTLYGTIAGLAKGFLDGAMMRLVDILLSVPFLFVVLILSARFSTNPISLGLIIGAFSWLVPARLVRGEVLSLRVREFVLAARVMGASRPRLILTHLIPNALGVIIVNITFQVADAILVVATLGFLGFGLSYPSTDWGSQLSDGATYISDGYWWLVYPVGACIILTVLALNLLGEALREMFARQTH
ncbi:binding-protein-dependent transporters inner membrane component [Rhodococcus erythropolis CCM2595]|uniref:ABC transporter permease n=1 Tax=Rhodococcus erythropolis TaxID=1833 RepID=UPI00038DC375|nr:ABC transporter permease [Rhodococcus erythropolis]AGT94800.1 binding-protein-dependent transporters inner membrane component [Rhodococcus erythropolis CCM2595]PBI88255.1 Oligopeptide transport system permease protein OppC [Rhodococcus erythropolis]SUE10839.1 binding-protein-dependent transporters inner membrane component [Rhodococcus erythropolis]